MLISKLQTHDIDRIDERGRTPIMNLDWSWYNVGKAAKIYLLLEAHQASLDTVDNNNMSVR